MNFLDKTFGRLGNRMFQMAALYSYAQHMADSHKKPLDIYFQDPGYFEMFEEDIRQLYKQEGEPLDYVAIHIRRGDYVDNPFYVDLTKTDYYKDAIKQFPDHKFLVFSDDINWCKGYLCNDRVDYSEGKSEYEDFNLMTRCKHQIIANSSFSWWAAYLNPNPNKKVIAPSVKNWHPDGVERTVCPQEWIRL